MISRFRRLAAAAALALGATAALAGCTSDAHRVSHNLSVDAEKFRIERKIVFYNGVTNQYIAEVDGKCSVDAQSGLSRTLAVTCKIGPGKYIKDDLGLSDNVTWFMLQQKPVAESIYRYKVVFKPQNIVPNLDVETGSQP